MTFSLAFFFHPWFGADDDDNRRGTDGVGRVEPGDTISQGRPIPASDRELIAQIRAGGLAAFETLFRTWHMSLCDFAVRYVGSMDVAEDVVEDVFASLWMRRAVWEPHAGIRAYLFGAVRNRVLVTLRDAGRRTDASVRAQREASREMTTGSLDEGDDRLVQVWRLVESLPEIQRAVVTMRWRAELSFDDIAAAIGSSPAAVKMQLSRAMRTLRERLARE